MQDKKGAPMPNFSEDKKNIPLKVKKDLERAVEMLKQNPSDLAKVCSVFRDRLLVVDDRMELSPFLGNDSLIKRTGRVIKPTIPCPDCMDSPLCVCVKWDEVREGCGDIWWCPISHLIYEGEINNV